MAKPTCVFIGRFQPFHNGHLMVLKGMVKLCDKVKVVIGSSDKSNSKDNPFDIRERKEMIQRALQDENIIPLHDVELLELADDPSDDAWADKCAAKISPCDACWSGDSSVLSLMKTRGIEGREIKEVPGISATEIRKRMSQAGNWQEMVPKAVAQYLFEIEGEQRVAKM
ncbi:MAG: nicotinamide-nucleotide adenylyltransferase [uncultured bacterium]|nr:MAG: nicotinamide-nucleotide adenylyltransferase [uncultured bacterium]HBD04954.1 hypothetical protein [Candidatus Uhrbacteria bacterium]